MTTHHIIAAITTSLALSAFAAEEKKTESVTKSESANAEAKAEAKSEATVVSSSTTSVNGKTVTTIVTKDKDGNERVQTITFSPSGKPKVKDITDQVKKTKPADKDAKPVEKKPAPQEKDSL